MCLLLSTAIFSCKKLDKKNPIEFTIKAHVPYSGEPISGVKYTIVEYRSKKFSSKFGDIEYTDFKLEGTTNANGIAEISYFPKKNLDYHYIINFDYSNIHFSGSSGNYSLINAPSYDIITRQDNSDYDIRILPHCGAHFKVENINCFDANDKVRFKGFNFDESPHNELQYTSYGNYAIGCGLLIEHINNSTLTGRRVYQIEVTRNNVVTTYIDTFFLQPGVMNDVFLEY
ncbi:MAG: hypothetical protein ACO1N0_21655 [Fluviicola sp.]